MIKRFNVGGGDKKNPKEELAEIRYFKSEYERIFSISKEENESMKVASAMLDNQYSEKTVLTSKVVEPVVDTQFKEQDFTQAM